LAGGAAFLRGWHEIAQFLEAPSTRSKIAVAVARHRRKQPRAPRLAAWTVAALALFIFILLPAVRRQAESAEAPPDQVPSRTDTRRHGIGTDARSGSGAERAALAASPHVALGIPTDADPTDEILLDRREYVLSYDAVRNGPNWASWQLDDSHLGPTHRRNDFRPDRLLPIGVYQVTPQDYADSGYDRGHLCPSADRARDATQNSLTFLMTNVQPQLHELNAGPWARLEKYERELAARTDAELYIVAGGIFEPNPPTIGRGVAVPRANYKVIVLLKKGQTAAEIATDTEVIAVVLPNLPGVSRHAWTEYLVSVDEIERQTGYDLLGNVPLPVQVEIEAAITRRAR
jgi:endonuclease G, mitochondrial